MDLDCSTKACSHCHRVLPASDFQKNRTTKDGLSSWCRDCQRIASRETYIKHRESRQVRNKAYALAHPEVAQKSAKAWRERNPDAYEHRRAYYQARYQTNKVQMAAYEKQYREKNRSAAALRTMRHYARKLHAAGTFTTLEWKALCGWFGNVCLGCGTTGKLEADHVIPLVNGGANSIDNIQPLCRVCNATKQTRDWDYRDPIHLTAFLEGLYG